MGASPGRCGLSGMTMKANDTSFPKPANSATASRMYKRLEPDKIVSTLETLARRIEERFPNSGLARVCGEALIAARRADRGARAVSKPYLGLRLGVGLVIIAGIAAQFFLFQFAHIERLSGDPISLFQGLEALVNLTLLAAGGAWFLLTLEERIKRARSLAAMHELRSLAHVIDMHQLTKDPTILLGNFHRRTAASPARSMSQFELTRYLEYCAEMLALTGKLAALYGENLRDPVVIGAVNDIESLCANLGRKIWQKITIIGQLDEAAGAAAPPPT